MATDKTKALREIQPRKSAYRGHEANGWRRSTSESAKRYGMSRRRFLRKVAKTKRTMRKAEQADG